MELDPQIQQEDTRTDYEIGLDEGRAEQATRITELEAKVTDLELKLLTERGAKAWKDVPDATAFVEELRGNTDKPDCVWHKYLFRREPDGKETFAYAAPCFPRYEASYKGQTVHMSKSNFCPNCGGSVKEST